MFPKFKKRKRLSTYIWYYTLTLYDKHNVKFKSFMNALQKNTNKRSFIMSVVSFCLMNADWLELSLS